MDRISQAKPQPRAGLSFLTLALIAPILFTATAQSASSQEQEPTVRAARTAFDTFQSICSSEAARVWPVSLCGPLILVDRDSRESWASQRPPFDGYEESRGVWSGTLPDSISVANTSTTFGNESWIMVIAPLPSDPFARIALLHHEAFHRVQAGLGLSAPDRAQAHLEESDGRTWLRMEIRALARALETTGRARREAGEDAVAFRLTRLRLFEADTLEADLETQEGLAAYTGARVALNATGEGEGRVGSAILEWDGAESFARTFAYATGPGLGLLLDDFDPDWRDRVAPDTPMFALLAEALGMTGHTPEDLGAEGRAVPYGLGQVRQAETERAEETRRRLAELRARFTEHVRLVLPLEAVQMSFDPNQIVSLSGLGTVYLSGTFTGAWGELSIESGGILIAEDWTTLTVSGPQQIDASTFRGGGWSLRLAPGWTVHREGDTWTAHKDGDRDQS